MRKLFLISVFLLANLNISLIADENKCGAFNFGCKTKKFIEKFVEKNDGEVISAYEFDFPIKKSMPFHTKDRKNEKAILYHIASLQ